MSWFESIATEIRKAMAVRGTLPWPWPIDEVAVKPYNRQKNDATDSIVVELFFTPDVAFENVKQGQRAKTVIVYHANTLTRWSRVATKGGPSMWPRIASAILYDALSTIVRETRRAGHSAACAHAERLREEERKRAVGV